MQTSHDRAVMVTGGSGFIGRKLVAELSQKELGPIVSMYRLRLPDPVKNVFPVCSDLGSVDLLAAPLRGVDTVVSLAWSKSIIGSEEALAFDPSYKNVTPNIKCLKNLIDAMELAGTKRLIFLSAVGASRKATTKFLKEKYLGELAVINSKIPEKVIIRSSMVYEPDLEKDSFIRTILNVMKFPGIYPVPKSDDTFAPIHIADLTQALITATTVDLAQPVAIVELSGGEEFKVEDLFRIVSERFARGSRLQLRGTLGHSLVPMFEKRGQYFRPDAPRIKDYLTLAVRKESPTPEENPFGPGLSEKRKSFRETLSKLSS